MGRGVEVLVHNVGHHDLYVLLGSSSKPVVGHMLGYKTRSMLTRLVKHLETTDVRVEGDALFFGRTMPLDWTRDDLTTWLQLDRKAVEALGADVTVAGVLLPLLGPVLKTWRSTTAEESLRRLLLVTTRSEGKQEAGTGTEQVVRFVELLVSARFPGVRVSNLVMSGDPFALDPKAMFAHEVLLPALVELRNDDPERRLSLTLSLSTGTLPMVFSIQNATAEFRPAFVHVPKARQKPRLGGAFEVELHDHEALMQCPPVETASLGGGRRKLVDDVRSWCAVGSPEARLPAADSELATFWLRKGLQGGLAAVLVDDGRGDPAVFRGMNLEVSLPTGMLCAERNAIGSALAQKPSLRRRDLRAVAILGVRVGEQDSLRDPNPLYPRGACMEWLRKVAEENPDFEMITFNDWTMAECFVQRVAAL